MLNDELTPPRAKVVVQVDEVSQAIGRGGINIRLASKLTGYEIDVYREISEEEEDIEIQEFSDEIPEELLQMLRNIGCDTARAVLELSRDELMRRTGMEEAYAEHVLNVIKAEFADEGSASIQAEKVTAAATTVSGESEEPKAEETSTPDEAPSEEAAPADQAPLEESAPADQASPEAEPAEATQETEEGSSDSNDSSDVDAEASTETEEEEKDAS